MREFWEVRLLEGWFRPAMSLFFNLFTTDLAVKLASRASCLISDGFDDTFQAVTSANVVLQFLVGVLQHQLLLLEDKPLQFAKLGMEVFELSQFVLHIDVSLIGCGLEVGWIWVGDNVIWY